MCGDVDACGRRPEATLQLCPLFVARACCAIRQASGVGSWCLALVALLEKS